MGQKKPTVVREGDQNLDVKTEKKKSSVLMEDDEYSVGTDLSKDLVLESTEEEAMLFAGTKNKKKDKNGNGTAHDGRDDDPLIVSCGDKKEFKKSKNGGSNSTLISSTKCHFEVLEEENGDRSELDENQENDVVEKVEVAPDAPAVITFSEKKKPSKSVKKEYSNIEEGALLDRDLTKFGDRVPLPKPTSVLSQEEEFRTQRDETTNVDVDDIVGEGRESKADIGESWSAKKKKKRKEKEKEKKSAEIEVSERKVSKHVRQILEILEIRRKAEEKKEHDEQEKKEREEESRRIEEERRREAEEIKRKKKEKEKEKLRKKKQEGKILTPKQKQQACRLEAMRRQFSIKIDLPTADNSYVKEQTQTNGAGTVNAVENVKVKKRQGDTVKVETAKEIDSAVAKAVRKLEVEHEAGVKNLDEEETVSEEWDAKSWDDCVLELLAKSASKKVDNSYVETHDVRSDGNESPCIEIAEHNRRKNSTTKWDDQTIPISNASNLRSPICCILGHVDTGKTKLLDCIRRTNVQEGEAGGITQQIGATFFPVENIRERTKELKADAELKLPGLLVIDTPGHEVFQNLRSRGSGLCDIAILVVDIMHGLEAQTIESLNLLKMRNTGFIVALNKVDRLYGWKTCRDAPIVKAIKMQSNDVQNEFNIRLNQIITEFKEQGLNTELYYKNKEMGETFSIVPTSAISGEGIPDLLLLLIQWSQKTMVQKLMFSNEVQCTILEVKVIEGLGTTVDVVLANGILHKGDQIVVFCKQGPIVTKIRALLTPHPMKELRVKGKYLRHKELKATQGIKISAQGLEQAIVGSSLYIVEPDNDVEDIKDTALRDNGSVKNIGKRGEGVHVQASTAGSLEALLGFLEKPAVNIPVSSTSIGPVHKKDVMRASIMLGKKKEYAAILAFDVQVTAEARELADEIGVEIFVTDIIYHLSDQFKSYIDKFEAQQKEGAKEAIFPCVLKILPNCVFNKKDPIVVGVRVLEGIAKVGTPICIPSRGCVDIGRITAIEINSKLVDTATKGQIVAVKITSSEPEEQQKKFGRHFSIDDDLVSHLTTKSIKALETYCQKDLSAEDWILFKELKKMFELRCRLYGTP